MPQHLIILTAALMVDPDNQITEGIALGQITEGTALHTIMAGMVVSMTMDQAVQTLEGAVVCPGTVGSLQTMRAWMKESCALSVGT